MTPKEKSTAFFQEEDIRELMIIDISEKKDIDMDVVKEEFKKFVSYWTELNASGKKQRWEAEKFFEIGRRLGTWFSRNKNFAPRKKDNLNSDVI